MDCSLPDSSVHGILQARILEWGAISFFRGSSQPRDRTCISGSSYTAGGFFTTEPPEKPNRFIIFCKQQHTNRPTRRPTFHLCLASCITWEAEMEGGVLGLREATCKSRGHVSIWLLSSFFSQYCIWIPSMALQWWDFHFLTFVLGRINYFCKLIFEAEKYIVIQFSLGV